jgi:hypothetical protein
MLQNYLACGSNSSEAIDFYALNAYEWCGQSTYEQSGYAGLIKQVTDVKYNIPIFLSETGCVEPENRDFADQEAIFGSEMTPNWSGAIIYEWIQEANKYGIVTYGPKVDPASPNAPPDGFPRSGTPIPKQPDFSNLSSRWKTLNPTGVKMSEYNPSLTAPPCPDATSGTWEVDPKSGLPTLGQTYNAQATGGSRASGSGGASNTGSGSGSGNGQAKPSETGKSAAVAVGSGAWKGLGLVGVLVAMCL